MKAKDFPTSIHFTHKYKKKEQQQKAQANCNLINYKIQPNKEKKN